MEAGACISHSLAKELLLTPAKRDKAVRIQQGPHNNGSTLGNARLKKICMAS